ncbi:hypothetical protein FSP39_010486 [Pinctada imbricata]|uniref:2'-phosphotransferase n=1 Tax=Pinctada imbricata TaxID=66713 RepID=A0AA89BVD0_PINIB|nr:hypothetical protein FSP39_002618 [Pinctada imbricata]KAK3097528.1 hypothetical protein FSP39_010486 [Pinctada imbricata]
MTSDSRRLVAALRHNRNLPFDENGWVQIRDLRQRQEFRNFDLYYIRHLAESMDKHRIELSVDGRSVRAISGHSFNVCLDTLLTPVEDTSQVTYCGHGTSIASLTGIMRRGLHRMGRQYIHFASHPSAIKRHSQVIIHLDVERYLQENPGTLFWTKNNTIVALGNRNGTIRPYFFRCTENL